LLLLAVVLFPFVAGLRDIITSVPSGTRGRQTHLPRN
jgi:hypothetical protein